MALKEEDFLSDKKILKIQRQAKGFGRRTIYNKNQIRFFMWVNKFYYKTK